MIYTDATKKAMQIAYEKHKNQVDKSGVPYIFNPIHVAEQMDDEKSTIVALLHDVVEDTDVTIDNLLNEGFTEEIVSAIKDMTKLKNEDYFEYLCRVKNNNISKKVKLADLRHNSDLSRLNIITDEDLKRIEKYRKAIDFLTN